MGKAGPVENSKLKTLPFKKLNFKKAGGKPRESSFYSWISKISIFSSDQASQGLVRKQFSFRRRRREVKNNFSEKKKRGGGKT